MTTTTSYQYVNMSNMNTFSDMLTAMNTSGAGYLFAGIDYLIFFVILITLTTMFGWESAILSASFIGLVLGLLFVYMGVMAWWLLSVFVGLLVFMIIYLTLTNRNT